MRARQIKPGILKNEILGSADPLLTLLFEGLWMLADREGRLEDRPLRICGELFPYRRRLTEKRVDEMLWWLDEHKFIARYTSACDAHTPVNNAFIQILEFHSHQNPHRDERPSIIQEFSPELHRARTVSARGRRSSEHSKNTVALGLTPSSLTPSSLTPCNSNPEHSADSDVQTKADEGGGGTRNERKPALTLVTPRALTLEEARQLQAAYPRGIYRQSDWIVAEKLINQHLANGVEFQRILGSMERYDAQCAARESIGTKYVASPIKHCDLELPQFDEPFPLPKTKAEVRQQANADAGAAWLAEQESENATG